MGVMDQDAEVSAKDLERIRSGLSGEARAQGEGQLR